MIDPYIPRCAWAFEYEGTCVRCGALEDAECGQPSVKFAQKRLQEKLHYHADDLFTALANLVVVAQGWERSDAAFSPPELHAAIALLQELTE